MLTPAYPVIIFFAAIFVVAPALHDIFDEECEPETCMVCKFAKTPGINIARLIAPARQPGQLDIQQTTNYKDPFTPRIVDTLPPTRAPPVS